MDRCVDYVGVTCVDGSCPVVNSGKHAELDMNVNNNCKSCDDYFRNKDCIDCALSGIECCFGQTFSP